ncbi:MAG: 4Fe-4S dicluster domain-containing protein [Oscillospiraceae bacterium]|nr:4Fe-4S dicluster domain-containing protein [Oscillospiraceae bacterium]
MHKATHSVTLESEKCKGCINCIKRCPTGAIRVRNSKAAILSDHCIDCGECIRVCPNYAKKAISDPLSVMKNYKYKVALPAPTLCGQFKKVRDVNIVLTALVKVDFDDVFEVSLAAQSISDYTKQILPELREKLRGPVISSACPVIVNLIRIRYPSLLDNVLKVLAPVELAAIAARKQAVKKTGLKPSEIGVFFISPCPAKITASKYPLGFDNVEIDGIFSMTEMYKKLLPVVEKIEKPLDLASAGVRGLRWSCAGGEGKAMDEDLFVSADGIDNVIRVLEEIDNDKLDSVRFVELNACAAGCVGGCLTVENPFVARARLQRIGSAMDDDKCRNSVDETLINSETLDWKSTPNSALTLRLDSDRSEAMRKLALIDKILTELPGIDCGSCGAPSCEAHAEDMVMGKAVDIDCVFKLRERMGVLFEEINKLHDYLPPPLTPDTRQGDGSSVL